MSASEKVAEKVAQTKATTNGQVKATEAALKETTAPVVYIGPTIPGVVMTNTILKEKGNEPSEAIALFSEKYPTVDVKIIAGSPSQNYNRAWLYACGCDRGAGRHLQKPGA